MLNFDREGIIFLALIVALATVIAAFALNASRSERDMERYGKPAFPPLRAGLLNIVPGLGLWKLGLPTKSIVWSTGLAYLAIVAALVWPKLSIESRMQFILTVCIGSALSAERTATEMWKNPKK